jgi:hypothetical protein
MKMWNRKKKNTSYWIIFLFRSKIKKRLSSAVSNYINKKLHGPALLEKSLVVQLLKNFSTFFGNRKLITVFSTGPSPEADQHGP